MIETRDLSLQLGAKHLLQNINIALPRGRFTAIIGPNGAGKSTLLSILGRLQNATTGSVLFDRTPLAQHAPRDLARRLSILRQANDITPRLTVAELVAFGRFPHAAGRLGEEDLQKIDDALAALALSDIRNQPLDTLSGGQRQRALIAMCLAQDTEALLLDEPLNNLDLSHARRVMSLCRQEATKGKTVAAVLHDLSATAVHADHVIALKNGKLHSAGHAAKVMTAQNLSDLYDTEIEVAELCGKTIVLTV